MSQTIDLKKVERKTFRSFFGDGLMDIYLGGLLLATGMLHVAFPDWSGSTVQRLGCGSV